MHPKNSTTHPVVQEQLLTDASSFYREAVGDADSGLLQVCAGKSVGTALNCSSMLMHSALEILERLTESGMGTNEIYGVRFLLESSAALVNASVRSAEFGNRRQGGEA
ncbi:hypothetical protein POF45_22010 [Pseudomonas sp. 681]|uniref:DUF3077 domain-containing protein n=1 Tax=Pseudomonas fungipugnans TaxID=3024217 RepID=A0ABT6QT49_9PSED|nr:hypothetical protein [Pseudomonas sp. 681]MDI2594083.1 hypothetical protein [Pseudomonas sp. 681]